MSSFGRDGLSHLSMSLHVQDRVFHLAPRLLDRVEVGTAGRRATAGRDLRVFSRCTSYCRIRSALAVLCFFAVGCPGRVCRNPPSIFGLFWTLPLPFQLALFNLGSFSSIWALVNFGDLRRSLFKSVFLDLPQIRSRRISSRCSKVWCLPQGCCKVCWAALAPWW